MHEAGLLVRLDAGSDPRSMHVCNEFADGVGYSTHPYRFPQSWQIASILPEPPFR